MESTKMISNATWAAVSARMKEAISRSSQSILDLTVTAVVAAALLTMIACWSSSAEGASRKSGVQKICASGAAATAYNVYLYDSQGSPQLATYCSINQTGHVIDDSVSPPQQIGTLQANNTILGNDGVTVIGYATAAPPSIK